MAEHPGRLLIVRDTDPDRLRAEIGAADLERIAYVQLSALPESTDCLRHWARDLPIELRLVDPGADYPRLYHHSALLDTHPVRVVLPVVEGFEQAVGLAASLQFAIRLEPGQPSPELIRGLARVLDTYLHRSTVAEPIEWFHSILLGRCHREAMNLWDIQEEDPACVRRIDDQGHERLPGRLRDHGPDGDPATLVQRLADGLRAAGAECADCPFFDACRGYFKRPRTDYDCGGVKSLFETLYQAADELRQDLADATDPQPRDQDQ